MSRMHLCWWIFWSHVRSFCRAVSIVSSQREGCRADSSLSPCESSQAPSASAGVCDQGPPASFHPPVMGISADVSVAAAPQVRRFEEEEAAIENEPEYAELYCRPHQCCVTIAKVQFRCYRLSYHSIGIHQKNAKLLWKPQNHFLFFFKEATSRNLTSSWPASWRAAVVSGSEFCLLWDPQRLWLLCYVWRQSKVCTRWTHSSLACTVSRSLVTQTIPVSTVRNHPVISDHIVIIDLHSRHF